MLERPREHGCTCVECTRNDSTRYSPFFLLFGRHPRLPTDLIFHASTPATKNDYPQYVSQWKNAMQEACRLAERQMNERSVQAKKYYDRWVRSSVLQPGDRVLVRNLSERGGPGKLRSFWEMTFTSWFNGRSGKSSL